MGDFSRIYKTELSDRQLMAFWRLVQASGRGRSIGFDAPPMDGPAFCRWMRRPSVHPWLVAWRGVPMALYWLSGLKGRSAEVHFCLLPCGVRRLDVPREAVPREAVPAGALSRSGRQTAEGGGVSGGQKVRLPLVRAAALFGLASVLWEAPEQGFRIDTLIGITPASNAPALALVRSLGAKEHGTVPGLCWLYEARLNVPGVLNTFDRETVPQRAASL